MSPHLELHSHTLYDNVLNYVKVFILYFTMSKANHGYVRV